MIKFCEWLELKEHRKGKKVNWKQCVYKGIREVEKEDLSKDYVGHMSNMGSLWPFSLKGKSRNKK